MNTEQERTDLLPCPFCGESKSLIVQHCEGTIIHPAYRIYCGNCGASSGYADRVDPAKNWNHRAALQSQSQDREDGAAWLNKLIDLAVSYGDSRHFEPEADDKREAVCRSTQAFAKLIDHASRIEGK